MSHTGPIGEPRKSRPKPRSRKQIGPNVINRKVYRVGGWGGGERWVRKLVGFSQNISSPLNQNLEPGTCFEVEKTDHPRIWFFFFWMFLET